MHWIQGKKSHEDGQPIIKVKVVAVHDDGRVENEGDGDIGEPESGYLVGIESPTDTTLLDTLPPKPRTPGHG